MKEFIEMLKKIKPNVDFENEEALVDDGILVTRYHLYHFRDSR